MRGTGADLIDQFRPEIFRTNVRIVDVFAWPKCDQKTRKEPNVCIVELGAKFDPKLL
jgi:hypothetical protein